jgi:hypothetical protein
VFQRHHLHYRLWSVAVTRQRGVIMLLRLN